MKSVFITNVPGQPNLKDRLTDLVSNAHELKFLVGFFYFSGIQELYEGLLNNDKVVLKILVGLNVDELNHQLIEIVQSSGMESKNELRSQYFDNLRISLNGEDFDNRDFYERMTLYIRMIKEDRLQIRKTRFPNHAKLYIAIDPGNKMCERTFITGSSNLTRAGLIGQAEFNVELSDFGVSKIAEEFFDELWQDSVQITEHAETKTKLIKLLTKEAQTREITPFEAYALALKNYLEVYDPDRKLGDSVEAAFEKNGYKKYRYQFDAIKQALTVIEQNNGVIIADVVGLGKSVIASAVGKALDKRGIIICPPGLIGDPDNKSGWKMYREQFGLYGWAIRSSGKLDKVEEFVRENGEFEIVIIDEAHRFRNADTEDFEHLQNICRNKKVMLLTATPFNNRPNDILSLLRLFIPPKKSTITLNPNIGATFRHFNFLFNRLSYIHRYHNSTDVEKKKNSQRYYEETVAELPVDLNLVDEIQQQIADEIRDVISPVLIRRNRMDLMENPDYADEISELSKIDDPIEWFYELSEEQSEFYDQIVTSFFAPQDEGGRFTGAIYQPILYQSEITQEDIDSITNQRKLTQTNLTEFMRRMLVKRFESSFGSFKCSIERFLEIYKNALIFIERRGEFILDRDLINKIYQEDDKVIDRALEAYKHKLTKKKSPKSAEIYDVNNFALKEKFLNDIRSDILLFGEVLDKLNQIDLVKDDPKSNCVIQKLKTQLQEEPERKVIIFSEYADTVTHLAEALTLDFGDKLLVVRGNLSRNMVQTINRNFDASNRNQADDYKILLSTDKISEGFNLNRAGMIINYDIPWNPVRVIQRVGRINRISKKVFEKLYIVNFFPTEKGTDYLKSREIAEQKMYLIHNTLGEDAKYFNADEEPTASALFNRIMEHPDKFETMSFYTKMYKRWNDMLQAHPDLEEYLASFPPRVKVAKAYQENNLLVCFRKNRFYIQRLLPDETAADPIPFEEALPLLECDYDEPALPLSEDFWPRYELAKQIRIDTRGQALSAQSVEYKAINNLETLKNLYLPELEQYQSFIETLLLDMKEWGMLPSQTLREISLFRFDNAERIMETKEALKALLLRIGADYLQKEIERQSQIKKEIVIVVENQEI